MQESRFYEVPLPFTHFPATMDFQGPLYDVRMSRGQGYNSYIQEPRLYEAVEIKLDDPQGATTKPEPAPSSEVVNKVNHAEVPQQPNPAPSGSELVRLLLDGLNKSSASAPTGNGPKKLPYLKPTPSGKANQTVLFSSKQVKSATEIDQAMGSKASAAVKAASIGPGAELGSNISTSDDFKGDAVNFLVTVKVVNEKPDRLETWTFREVNKLKSRLSSVYCEACIISGTEKEHAIIEDTTPFSGNIAQAEEAEYRHVVERERAKTPCHACGHKRAIEFTRIYGDTFISDFVEGGEIYALVNIRSSSKTKLKDLKAYASAQLTPAAVPLQVKVDTEFTKSGKEAWDQAETSIRVQWRGGGEIKTHDFQWGLDSLIEIANAFPTFVAATSAKIRAVLTPYSALESFQRLQNIFPQHPLTLNYNRCALFVETLYEDYKAFRSMWDDLNTIIDSPEKYIERKVAQEKEVARIKTEPAQDRRARIGRDMKDFGIEATDQAESYPVVGQEYTPRERMMDRSNTRSNSVASSVLTNNQIARAQRFLSKFVNRTAGPESSPLSEGNAAQRRASNLTVPPRQAFGQRLEANPAHSATPAEQADLHNTNPQITATIVPSMKQNGDSASRDPGLSPIEAPMTAAAEVESSVPSVLGEQVPAAGHFHGTRNIADPSALLLTNLADILTLKDSEDMKLAPLRPTETHKLSRLRQVCRFAMLHIQDLAANLVLDPQNTDIDFGRRDSGMPMFVQPRYPYPATIRSILPVKPDSGKNKPDYGAWHYTCVEDLRFPDSMKDFPGSPYPDDYSYWWDVYGDALSDYKKYEFFQLGNFDPHNEKYPQAIAFQINGSRIVGYLDRKTRNDENMISGLALRYAPEDAPFPPYNDMENQLLSTGELPKTEADVSANPSLYYSVCAGKPPTSEESWVPIMWNGDGAPFNRFNVYHKQGSGRVSGLAVYRDDEGADGEVFFDSVQQGIPLISHKAWEGKNRKPSALPPQYNSVPGDGFSAQKAWMFAGLVGAFAKTGPFRHDRALAKLAIVWKRRASQLPTEEI